MIRQIKRKIMNIYDKIKFRRKLKSMDELWSLYGGSCFGLCPPSFYHTHSEEEIQRHQQEEIAKLKEILNKFSQQQHKS